MTITRRRFGASAAIAAAAMATPGLVRAQGAAWPARNVRLVVPFAAGGAPDSIARPVAEKLSQRWGRQVVIENRAGAGSNVGTEAVKNAEPDGYTLLLSSFATAVNQFLYRSVPFDALADFAHVSHLANVPNFVIVPPNSPFRTIPELIAHARANPEALSFGSSGAGSSLHLLAALLAANTGVRFTHVPYRGSAPALTDIMGGRLDFMFNSIGTTLGQWRGGQVRALSVTTAARVPQAPDVPTMTELGIPGFPASSWFALSAPARTPRPIIDRIAADARWALAEPDVVRLMADTANEIVGSDPDGLVRHIRAEMERWGPVIRANNISAEG
jgi:tripartite-type tricarboxylate transporter receptor subunit TctC